MRRVTVRRDIDQREAFRVRQGFRIERRTIRRVMVVASSSLIIYSGKKYYVEGNVSYPVIEVNGNQVIEDPNDPTAYIALKV